MMSALTLLLFVVICIFDGFVDSQYCDIGGICDCSAYRACYYQKIIDCYNGIECNVNCGEQGCKQSIINCNNATNCNIYCNGQESCNSAEINCGYTANCKIHSNQYRSVYYATINGNKANNLSVFSTDSFDDTLRGTTVNCNDGTINCNIDCNGDEGCNSLTVNCPILSQGTCNIHCNTGYRGCYSIDIHSENSQYVNIKCNQEITGQTQEICWFMDIWCPHSGFCHIIGDPDTSGMKSMNIYVDSGFNGVTVSGISTGTSIGTINCDSGTCSIDPNDNNACNSMGACDATPTLNPTTVIPTTSNPTTASPTNNPTPSPTNNPTPTPTNNPTPSPTNNPTPSPTNNPTSSPTNNPTSSPTNNPTPTPTNNPTSSPTNNTTPSPTNNPSPPPTINPAPSPTNNAGPPSPTDDRYSTISPTDSTGSPTNTSMPSSTNNPTSKLTVPPKNPLFLTTSATATPSIFETDGQSQTDNSSFLQSIMDKIIVILLLLVLICCMAVIVTILKTKKPENINKNVLNNDGIKGEGVPDLAQQTAVRSNSVSIKKIKLKLDNLSNKKKSFNDVLIDDNAIDYVRNTQMSTMNNDEPTRTETGTGNESNDLYDSGRKENDDYETPRFPYYNFKTKKTDISIYKMEGVDININNDTNNALPITPSCPYKNEPKHIQIDNENDETFMNAPRCIAMQSIKVNALPTESGDV